MWHYCGGFFTESPEAVGKSIENWKQKGFNQETKDFFAIHCNCVSLGGKEEKVSLPVLELEFKAR